MGKRSLYAMLVVATVVVGLLSAPGASAEPVGYQFAQLAFLGDAVPAGGTFVFDFEPWDINRQGDVSFGADLSTGGEGVFVARDGEIVEIARTGGAAPGGGTLGPFFLGNLTLNDAGDMAFAFGLEPFAFPLGTNAGLFRYSRITESITPVVVPGAPAPGGGLFEGVGFSPVMNNQGIIVFSGLVSSADISAGPPGVDGLDLGAGIFVVNRSGAVSSVVRPGDPAPGGGIFDFVTNPWINDRGDIAFEGHVQGQECVEFLPQDVSIHCLGNVYIRRAMNGGVSLIARQGDPAPGGGIYRFARGPVLNNRGEIAFIGDLTPAPAVFEDVALFLHSEGTIGPVARPGDPMPGGGTVLRTGFISTYSLDARGDVSFQARLEDGGDGLYVRSGGSLRLVARTGNLIPGVGTIVALLPPDLIGIDPSPWIGAASNERGQLIFTAAVDDGSGSLGGVLLVATPGP